MAPKGQYFRANAGIVIVNASGKVLVLERSDVPGAWQFPQGGIKQGEEPVDAALRELTEETNIDGSLGRIVAEYPEWLVYELPATARSEKTGRGQAQKWFVFEFAGSDSDIKLDQDEKEFARFEWIDAEVAVERAVEFRREIYRRLADFLQQRRLSKM